LTVGDKDQSTAPYNYCSIPLESGLYQSSGSYHYRHRFSYHRQSERTTVLHLHSGIYNRSTALRLPRILQHRFCAGWSDNVVPSNMRHRSSPTNATSPLCTFSCQVASYQPPNSSSCIRALLSEQSYLEGCQNQRPQHFPKVRQPPESEYPPILSHGCSHEPHTYQYTWMPTKTAYAMRITTSFGA